MTPQELAALPQGTRVRFFIENKMFMFKVFGTLVDVHDYGVIGLAGPITRVTWDNGSTTLIDTKSKAWEGFIREMELA